MPFGREIIEARLGPSRAGPSGRNPTNFFKRGCK